MENKYSIADELDTWQKQQDYLSIMKALSNKFDSVYILDMDTGIVVPFFLSEKNKLEYQDAFARLVLLGINPTSPSALIFLRIRRTMVTSMRLSLLRLRHNLLLQNSARF